jgi:IstB-like ATP binding protein
LLVRDLDGDSIGLFGELKQLATKHRVIAFLSHLTPLRRSLVGAHDRPSELSRKILLFGVAHLDCLLRGGRRVAVVDRLCDVLPDRDRAWDWGMVLHDRGSIVVTSQLPVDRWYEIIGNPTIADAVLDRLVHNAYRIELKGESMRKKKAPETPPSAV